MLADRVRGGATRSDRISEQIVQQDRQKIGKGSRGD
jgi:hypothetical protein